MAPLLTTTALLSLLALSSAQLQLDIQKNFDVQTKQLKARQLSLQQRAIAGRADSVQATLGNDEQEGLYFANITIGTPGQSFGVQIDTGSSDLWVPASSAALCSDAQDGGCPLGSFDQTKSSTFNVVEKGGFNISYVDGTGSTGDYFQDTFSIGGQTVENFQMGIATNTTIGIGIMGVGYNTSESNIDTGNGTEYPNLPISLVNSGLIKSAAYSLWLNDLQATSGSVLFGAVDTAKYSGDLISVQVYPDSESGQIDSFTVALTSLSVTSSSGTDVLTPSNYAAAVILDSGTTLTLLPDDVAKGVFEEVGAVNDAKLGIIVPCSLAENTGTINYQFGGTSGPTIKVSMSQLVLPIVLDNGQVPTFTKTGAAVCQLGIQPAGNLPVLFGDTFLRSAYVVYDLENNRIALAPTDFNATKSNIVSFASKGAPIPSATSASNEATVTQTATGIPKDGNNPTATGSAGSITYNPTATGLSAASGFLSTSTSSSKKSGGVEGSRPFQYSTVIVGLITMLGMSIGGGVFALL